MLGIENLEKILNRKTKILTKTYKGNVFLFQI